MLAVAAFVTEEAVTGQPVVQLTCAPQHSMCGPVCVQCVCVAPAPLAATGTRGSPSHSLWQATRHSRPPAPLTTSEHARIRASPRRMHMHVPGAGLGSSSPYLSSRRYSASSTVPLQRRHSAPLEGMLLLHVTKRIVYGSGALRPGCWVVGWQRRKVLGTALTTVVYRTL